jgi:hypothetical protein
MITLELFLFFNLAKVFGFYIKNNRYITKIVMSGKPQRREWISTIDLLALSSLDQLLFILKLYFSYFTKQHILMRSSTVLILPLQ